MIACYTKLSDKNKNFLSVQNINFSDLKLPVLCNIARAITHFPTLCIKSILEPNRILLVSRYVFQEDLLIHGDSVYDIIDKQDHQAIQCELGRPVVNTGTNNNAQEESRLFLCRMNVSRNARRQMRFGDQKVSLTLCDHERI